MKILMVNKFLHPNGGSETYIFKLGDYLKSRGHEVEYFGMEHKGRRVSNSAGLYTADMDFHGGGRLAKLAYPIKTIYSSDAAKKITAVLEKFEPDVIHLNNFNYQLTPSVITASDKWRKKNGKKCEIVFTAHDYQLLCPNHMMRNPQSGAICEKCLGGRFINCFKGKCVHGSAAKSAVGTAEAYFWRLRGAYRLIDKVICCSNFLKLKMDANPVFAGKTVAMHNFIDRPEPKKTEKKDYILYFGRFSEEKGIGTLIDVCRELSGIRFVFAGTGPLSDKINGVSNIENVGFKSGEELEDLIRGARLSVYPSRWYENCPFSVMESLTLGTPVLGADIGGIPELIADGVTGALFESGNAADLKSKIISLWNDRERLDALTKNCENVKFDTVAEYCEKLMEIYNGR